MTTRVREVEVFLRRVRTRMPFRYGKAEVTELPYAHLRVRLDPEGRGVSAAALPPLWFDKRPATHEENVRQLLRSIAIAADVYRDAGSGSAFELHRRCEPEARRRAAAEGMNGLTAGFGVALLDAALVDASCRRAGRTFRKGLEEDLFGFGPLPLPPPSSRIAVRHTVGLADPITAGDAATRIGDGLPETLEDVVRATGVRWFKVKISGDLDASLERLTRIASVLSGDFRVTLDGNEQFQDLDGVKEIVRRIEERGALRELWKRTAWIEQPIERSRALDAPVREIPKPLLIDESDDEDGAVDRAIALGYRGISAKNCKGVFRTLHSFRRATAAGALLSSEDLMNIPVVPLHQDLCVAAALGIPHSERNGHHYVRAFDYFSPRERETALREYPELYRADPAGLRIENGEIDVSGINAFGFGVRSEPDWDFLSPS